uniref:Uncharacterized protein n=1 Tax=Anguilla anguilla TaxID=7936 RepID=A0A0E9T0S0_ANGAN
MTTYAVHLLCSEWPLLTCRKWEKHMKCKTYSPKNSPPIYFNVTTKHHKHKHQRNILKK